MAAIKQLAAVARSGTGKGAARSVRREGRVPAVIYGGGAKPEPISVDYKDVNKLIFAGHFLTSIFELEIEGARSGSCRATISSTSSPTGRFMSIFCGSPRLARAHRRPRACRQSRSFAGREKGRRGQYRAAHGRADGACRRHSRIDHHRPYRHRFPRFGACVRSNCPRAAGRSAARPTHGGDDRAADGHGRGGAERRGGAAATAAAGAAPLRLRPALRCGGAGKGAAAPAPERRATPAAAAKPAAKK